VARRRQYSIELGFQPFDNEPVDRRSEFLLPFSYRGVVMPNRLVEQLHNPGNISAARCIVFCPQIASQSLTHTHR
jgi:hypothetical protein